MTGGTDPTRLHGTLVLDHSITLTVEEFCQAGHLERDLLVAMVEEGILDPRDHPSGDWVFPAAALSRVRSALRLQHDLGINLAGVALVLELLDEIRTLRERVQRLELE